MSTQIMQQIMAWNDSFSFKVKENDLKKPTEDKVTYLFLAYLDNFYFDTTRMRIVLNSENKDDQLRMKIKLIGTIDRFYKISSEKNSFQYLDLISPSPKKIQHIFANLLNYFVWYDQTRLKILEKAEGVFKDNDDSMKQLKKLKNEKEIIKARSKTIQDDINKKTKSNPKLAVKVETLRNELRNLEKQKESLQKLKKLCEDDISQLKAKYKDWEERVISDDEYISLLQKENSIRKELKELNSTAENESNNKKQQTKRIREMEFLVNDVESVLSNNPEKFVPMNDKIFGNEYKIFEDKLYQKQAIEKKIEIASESIINLQTMNESKEKDMEKLNNNLCKQQIDCLSLLESKVKNIVRTENDIKKATLILSKEEDLNAFLINSAEIIIKEQTNILE